MPDDLVLAAGAGTRPRPAPTAGRSRARPTSGSDRAQGFTAPGRPAAGRPRGTYVPATSLRTNQWTLGGMWNVAGEVRPGGRRPAGASPTVSARATCTCVLGPTQDGRPVRFRVRIDGQPPKDDHGSDTDAEGFGQVDAQRCTSSCASARPPPTALFEIEFLDPGVRAYAFTFG